MLKKKWKYIFISIVTTKALGETLCYFRITRNTLDFTFFHNYIGNMENNCGTIEFNKRYNEFYDNILEILGRVMPKKE